MTGERSKQECYELMKRQWEEAERRKYDAEKSKGLLGGISGLGLPSSLSKSEYEKARKSIEDFDLRKIYAEKASKAWAKEIDKTLTETMLKGTSVTSVVTEDLYAKYSHYPQFREGIKQLDKAIADYIIQNDLDPETVQLDVTVRADYDVYYLGIRVTTQYKLECPPDSKSGLVQSHIMHYTVLIDEDHK